MSFSKKLEQRGFNVIGDSQKTDIPFTGVDIVTNRGFIADQPVLIENMLKALLESLAYLIAPKNQSRGGGADHEKAPPQRLRDR